MCLKEPQQHVRQAGCKKSKVCESVQDGVTLSAMVVSASNTAAIEFLKPAGVKRKRHHTFAKGYAWGGFNAVREAALAMPAAALLKHCSACLPWQRARTLVAVHRQSLLVGGRYLKLKRHVPQSPWLPGGTDRGRTVHSSVQVRICSTFCYCTASSIGETPDCHRITGQASVCAYSALGQET